MLSFFSTEDRIHSLRSEDLQQVVNSVLFEPARFLHADVTGELSSRSGFLLIGLVGV